MNTGMRHGGQGRTADRKSAWLRRYLANECEVERLSGEIARWEGVPLQLVMGGDGGAACPVAPGPGSGVERLAERLEALRAALTAELERRVALRFEMEGAISCLADERFQLVLRLRFIEGLSLEQAADRMHYSFRQVCNISAKAIEELRIPGEMSS